MKRTKRLGLLRVEGDIDPSYLHEYSTSMTITVVGIPLILTGIVVSLVAGPLIGGPIIAVGILGTILSFLGKMAREEDTETIRSAYQDARETLRIARSNRLKDDPDTQATAEAVISHYHAMLSEANSIRIDQRKKADTSAKTQQRSKALEDDLIHLREALTALRRLREEEHALEAPTPQRELLDQQAQHAEENTRRLLHELNAHTEKANTILA